jgi:hypothetical protein
MPAVIDRRQEEHIESPDELGILFIEAVSHDRFVQPVGHPAGVELRLQLTVPLTIDVGHGFLLRQLNYRIYQSGLIGVKGWKKRVVTHFEIPSRHARGSGHPEVLITGLLSRSDRRRCAHQVGSRRFPACAGMTIQKLIPD